MRITFLVHTLLWGLFIFPSDVSQAGSWGKNRLWNDGRAEVAMYDSERVVYGKPRTFREQILTVKEDLRTDTLVKADKPKKTKTRSVFKVNIVQKFQTENYPYSYLTSVFVDAKNPAKLIKMTVGSQEWCGNTFKILKNDWKEYKGTLKWHSYFDGEADKTIQLQFDKNHHFRDQLPISLRDLPFAEGYQTKIVVWDALTSNRGIAPTFVETKVQVGDVETIRSYGGQIESWKVVLTSPKGKDTYWFDKKYPHILTKMETHNGQKRLIHGQARWTYWDRRLPMPRKLK